MDHGATAPAVNRRVAHTSLKAGLCAFIFQCALTSALAEGDFVDPSLQTDRFEGILFQASEFETAAAELNFVPETGQAAVQATPVRVLAEPVAMPRSKPAIESKVLAVAASVGVDNKPGPTKLFGSIGKSVSLSPVTKRWQRALAGFETEGENSGSDRNSFREYATILKQVQSHRRGLQIPKINFMVNRLLAYREDSVLYSSGEYWASPVESLSRRAGDCEDYAILKYVLLRDLGVKDEDMRIVVLRDTAARQYHAVLSVRHKGQWLILDNRFSRVRFERDLPHYQALYSVNAAGEWAHTTKQRSPVRLAARLKSATR